MNRTVIALLASFSFVSQASGDELIRVQSWEIDWVNHPKQLHDVAADWMASKEGAAIATAVATYYGVDPESVAAAHTAAKAIREKRDGETKKIFIPTDPGYKFCNAEVAFHQRKGKGRFGGTVNSDDLLGLSVTLRTPPIGKGKSEVKATLTVSAVRSDAFGQYDSRCTYERIDDKGRRVVFDYVWNKW